MNKTSASEVCSLNQPDTKGMHNFTLGTCLNCPLWYHLYGHSNESELLPILITLAEGATKVTEGIKIKLSRLP